jgi:ABC-2 type transport system permease protein
MPGDGPPAGEARLLWLLLRTNARQAWRRLLSVRQQSRLLSSLIGAFLIGYAGLAFLIFYKGLKFAGTFPGLGQVLVERMLFLLFAFLFVLLLFSNLVIAYTNLFRNRETTFLLTLPLPSQTIFQWKFIESALLASWAFLFLIAPLLAAYGLTQNVPWHFYLVTVILIGLFIVLPAVAGSWCAILLGRFLDRRSFQMAALAVAVAVLAACALWLKPDAVTDEELETRVLVVLDRLLLKTRFALFPLLPSYWMASGVQQWAEGALRSAGFFGLVLTSHVLFFGSLTLAGAGGQFYRAASAVQSRGSVLGRWAWFRAWRDRQTVGARRRGLVHWVVGWVPGLRPDVRALMVKDTLVFWRDTTQWGQSLVLFGLIAVYILNLRHFTQQLSSPFWIFVVSHLNLAACSLNLATLTTRFVYPQFSLEGKRLWIIGMAPIGLPRVNLVKYGFAAAATLVVSCGLMVVSCRMLQMPWSRTLYFGLIVSVMTLTLNALAVGLGALYPNFKEDNPSKIVSGFGGTFCLVISFLYVVGVVAVMALGSPWDRHGELNLSKLAFAWTVFLALCVLVGGLPLRLGLQRLKRFEH